MDHSEKENDASFFDDKCEKVVVERAKKRKMKRLIMRFLKTLFYVLLIMSVVTSTYVYAVKEKTFRDGGYLENWIDGVDGVRLNGLSYSEYPSQEMDVYVPQTLDLEKANGAILFIHGGAWVGGSRWEQEGFAKAIAKEGYLVANMDYTLYDDLKARRNEYNIELVLEDVRLALAKLVEVGKKYGYRVDRVALSGHSAGGQLSMLYGFRSGTREDFESPVKIAFIAPRAAPVDFHEKAWGEEYDAGNMAEIASFLTGVEVSEQQYLEPDEKTEEALKSLSPLYEVKQGVPPTFAAYGANDSLLSPQNYEELERVFAELNAKSVFEIEPNDMETQVFDLLVFPNSNHILAHDPDYTRKWRELLKTYAERYLVVPLRPEMNAE